MFTNHQKEVEEKLAKYCQAVADCLEQFDLVMRTFCDDRNRERLGERIVDVHAAESHADDIRRDIETQLYAKALFPESRGDLLGLLETMDRVPNSAETVVRMIYNQRLDIPTELTPLVLEILTLTTRAVHALLESVGKLFSDYTAATVPIGTIDELESCVDGVEAKMIQRIFDSDLDGFQKILLRDLTRGLGSITDRAEAVGDCIRILVAKRSI